MYKIKKLLGKFRKKEADIYKDKIYMAVKLRDIEMLKKDLQELECINPKEAVRFLEDILDNIEHNNKLHNQRIDIIEDIKDTVDIMLTNYQRNFFVDNKSSQIKWDKLEDIRKNYNMLKPSLSENKQKVHKNEQIQDILYQALERFERCKKPYPEILLHFFKSVIKKDLKELEELIDSIKTDKEYRYLFEQIKISYTMSNLKEEIKSLKQDEEKLKSSRQHKNLLEIDIKLWKLVKGLEKDVELNEVGEYSGRPVEKDMVRVEMF